jgi:hypothetical protein
MHCLVVQSCGMGKTKLLYELRNLLQKGSEYGCQMILCRNGGMPLKSGDDVFSQSIDFSEKMNDGQARQQEKYTTVGLALDSIVDTFVASKKKFFYLMRPNICSKMLGSSFVASSGGCVRIVQINKLWPFLQEPVVNFRAEHPKSSSSRESAVSVYNAENGDRLYEPFYRLHTIGCILPPYDNKYSEYYNSVQYELPLLSVMQAKDELTPAALHMILERMLLLKSADVSEELSTHACMNIMLLQPGYRWGELRLQWLPISWRKRTPTLSACRCEVKMAKATSPSWRTSQTRCALDWPCGFMDDTWHSGRRRQVAFEPGEILLG